MTRALQGRRVLVIEDESLVAMLLETILDDSLAPPGQHVASLFCQHVSPDLADEHRDTVADLMIETV